MSRSISWPTSLPSFWAPFCLLRHRPCSCHRRFVPWGLRCRPPCPGQVRSTRQRQARWRRGSVYASDRSPTVFLGCCSGQCFEVFFRRVSTMPVCAWFRRHDQLSVSGACSNANDPLLPMRLQSPRPRRMIGAGARPARVARTTRSGTMTKGSDLLVTALENEGVDRIYALPGEENLDVLESLRHSKIELVLTRHEQAAAFMAATQGRLTGRPGVCLSTLGPGALNFTTAAAYADLGAMPMLMITGQKAIKSARQARFQIVDIVGAMRPLTKMTRQIVSAASIPTTARDAFRIAVEERPGPVHLELPEDIAADEADVAVVPPHPIDRPIASPSALDRAAAMILEAKRPLIMIGAAGNRPRLVDALSDFVRRTGIS